MKRPGQRRAFRDVCWALLAFFALQIAFVLLIDFRRPEVYDHEYGVRLELLQERREEAPDRPLLLVVGSSRLGMGFAPSELPTLMTADGRWALPFNFTHLGAGPHMNLLNLDRLLRQGIRPDWVILEVVPGGLAHEGTLSLLSLSDLPLACRYSNPIKTASVYLRNRLNPFYKYRQGALEQWAPSLKTSHPHEIKLSLLPLGDDNWLHLAPDSKEKRVNRSRQAEAIYASRLADLTIDPDLERALRDSLAVLRRHDIPTVLLVAPEDSTFRSWYSLQTEQRLTDLFELLHQEYGVPAIDARAWVSDKGFFDPHHLNRRGASAFTARLGQEVLLPLVEGRPLRDGFRKTECDVQIADSD